MKKRLLVILLFTCLFTLCGCGNKQINNNSNNAERTSYSKKKEEVEVNSFSTPILDQTPNRVDNISLTCSKINGIIVKKGETFSFCDTIGDVNEDTGYKKASVLDSNGKPFQGYGGGNCQVSSTLYNAVKDVDGIEIIERHVHSKDVYYIEKGKDAAIETGSHLDFQFKNNSNYDIKIKANNTNEEVTVKIFNLK